VRIRKWLVELMRTNEQNKTEKTMRLIRRKLSMKVAIKPHIRIVSIV